MIIVRALETAGVNIAVTGDETGEYLDQLKDGASVNDWARCNDKTNDGKG